MPFPDQHRAWFHDVCNLLGLDDANGVIEDGGFLLAGIQPFLFTQGLIGNGSHILVQGVIDELPEEGAEEVLRKAMAYQMMISGPSAPHLGFEPETNSLFLIQSITPADTPPDLAVAMLRMNAATIHVLRGILFATESEEASASAGLDPALLSAQEQQRALLAQTGV